ncbi:MAG: alcohol dehydrogenase catalytic domain-containing protein [Gammaproteobacteria bacterium]
MLARAAVLERLGERLAIHSLDLGPPSAGQVLVKVLFSGVCRSQLMEVQGKRGTDPWLPHLLGHEGSGIVEAIGAGVSKVRPGDAVILTWIKGEGLDAPGGFFQRNGERINAGAVTTFSDYTVVSENRLVHKPPGLGFDLAVLFGCALPTGGGMVMNELDVRPGSTAIVLGLGGVGLSALMTLRALGVERPIAIDSSPAKLELASSWGAIPVPGDHPELQREVFRHIPGGADFCIEAGGSVNTIELGFSLIRKGGGQLLFASHPPEGQMICLHPHELISGKRIAGSWGGAVRPDRDVPRLHQLLQSSGPLESLLTQRYTLDQVNDALSDLEAGRVFRPLLDMGHPLP